MAKCTDAITSKSYNFQSAEDNFKIFHSDKANKLEHLRSESVINEDVLDSSDVRLMLDVMQQSPYREQARNFYPNKENKKLVEQIIYPIIDSMVDVEWEQQFQFIFYDWHGDGVGKNQKIHTDGWKPESKVFRNFLFPLETSFETGTLTFETYSARSTKITMQSSGEWRSTCPVFYKYQSEMGFDFFEEGHENTDHFELLSEENRLCTVGHRVEKFIPYKVGSVISFDSLRFHTPCFIPSGQYKKGLTVSVSEV